MQGKLSISRTLEGSLLIHPENVNVILIQQDQQIHLLSNQEPSGAFKVNAIVRAQ